MKIGYARVSTDKQDVEAQVEELQKLGAEQDRIYIDHGYTGRTKDRTAFKEALAACREGDQFVVTKLSRFARNNRDAHEIARELEGRGVCLNINGSIHNPKDPMGKLMFSIMAAFAEFEVDVIRASTRDGMAVAKAKGRLKGKKPKLSATQQKHLIQLREAGEHTDGEIAELFGVARSTVYRTRKRAELRDSAADSSAESIVRQKRHGVNASAI